MVSAFSTTGLSLSYTTQLTGFGTAIIMLCMLWGRLGTLTIVVALGRQRPGLGPRAEYLEERLLLGERIKPHFRLRLAACCRSG